MFICNIIQYYLVLKKKVLFDLVLKVHCCEKLCSCDIYDYSLESLFKVNRKFCIVMIIIQVHQFLSNLIYEIYHHKLCNIKFTFESIS